MSEASDHEQLLDRRSSTAAVTRKYMEMLQASIYDWRNIFWS